MWLAWACVEVQNHPVSDHYRYDQPRIVDVSPKCRTKEMFGFTFMDPDTSALVCEGNPPRVEVTVKVLNPVDVAPIMIEGRTWQGIPRSGAKITGAL